MRKLCLLLTLSLLAGCSQLAQPPLPPLAFDPQQALALQQWSAQGRIGIRWPGDNQSARLQWDQQADAYRIRLSGPLGQGGLLIEGGEQAVTLRRSGDDTLYRADSPEALMQQLLGWHLPLSEAGYWLRGIPAPGSPARPLREGSPGFIQSGWRIEYPRLMRAGARVLPQKLQLSRKELQITVIFNHWQTDGDH